MGYYVYVHTNKINGKKYVGLTTGIPKYRWRSDGSGYRQQPHFYNSIKKYGWDNFEHQVFEVNSKEEMYFLEQYLIGFYNTMNVDKGYNKSKGGESGNNQMKNSYSEEYDKEYKKQYIQTHKEELKKKSQEYCLTHKEKIKKKHQEYYQKHKDHIKERVRKYKEEHLEDVKERNRKWSAEHRAEVSERCKKWKDEHKEKQLEYNRSYLKMWRKNKQNKLLTEQ